MNDDGLIHTDPALAEHLRRRMAEGPTLNAWYERAQANSRTTGRVTPAPDASGTQESRRATAQDVHHGALEVAAEYATPQQALWRAYQVFTGPADPVQTVQTLRVEEALRVMLGAAGWIDGYLDGRKWVPGEPPRPTRPAGLLARFREYARAMKGVANKW